ncbi:MAG TPA: hypothetical protein VJV23_04375 [Candidatus Polarisedimenticolia bacterium]|nr:hypothetical protein [Candidatus Polarisedimenticolia bacterium]
MTRRGTSVTAAPLLLAAVVLAGWGCAGGTVAGDAVEVTYYYLPG